MILLITGPGTEQETMLVNKISQRTTPHRTVLILQQAPRGGYVMRDYKPIKHDPDWVMIAAWVVALAFAAGFWYAISILV